MDMNLLLYMFRNHIKYHQFNGNELLIYVTPITLHKFDKWQLSIKY